MKNEEIHPAEDEKPIEPEIVEEAMTVRPPRAATTIAQLAEREDGLLIVERAVQTVTTLRRASIMMTNPDDWTLYRSPEGRITAYLESLAAWNLRPLWGVSTVRAEKPYQITHEDGTFVWCIDGDGYCARTDVDILNVTAACYSNEDFLIHRKLHPVKLEIEMKRTARQRLEGIFVREGAGLKRIPTEELDDVWKGTWKRSALCPKGRGFGSADERIGGASKSGIDPADIPNCPACAKSGITVKLLFRPGKGDRESFLGCPNYSKHPNDKVIIPLSTLKEEIQKRQPPPQPPLAREPGDEE